MSQKRNQRNLETNENEITTYQNAWDISRAALRRKLIRINPYIKKLKQLNFTQKEQVKPKLGTKEEITRIIVEIHVILRNTCVNVHR